jgi:hypothetical protein
MAMNDLIVAAEKCHASLMELAKADRTKWTEQYWRLLENHGAEMHNAVCRHQRKGKACDLVRGHPGQHSQKTSATGRVWWSEHLPDDRDAAIKPSTMMVDSLLPRLAELEQIEHEAGTFATSTRTATHDMYEQFMEQRVDPDEELNNPIPDFYHWDTFRRRCLHMMGWSQCELDADHEGAHRTGLD